MARTADVVVVGGGVIGCSIAYHLSKRGVRSALIESRRIGSGASGATVGVVGPLWHVPRTPEHLFALGLRSLEAFPTLAEELREAGIDPEFRQSGILRIALTAGDVEAMRRDLAWQGELGLDVQWLSRDDVLEREPAITPEVLGGVFSPREGYVRGQRLADSLANAATRLGARVIEGVEVTGLELEGRRVIGVRTAGDTWHADHVVLAAGPWSGIAGRWIPDPIPVRPVKGQRILLRKSGLLPKSPVGYPGAYVVPQVDGDLLIGATRHEGEFDEAITAEALSQMLSAAVRVFPSAGQARFVAARAGVRPGSPDDVPIIGPAPGWDGLSIAAGHDVAGIMLSPGTGMMVADYVATGNSGEVSPFSLARFRGLATG